MLLNDIGDYLSSQGGYVQASTLFLGKRPEQPDTCLTVAEWQGLPAVHAFSALPGQAVVERAVIQVVARGAAEDYQPTRLNAQNAWALLDGLSRTINGVSYKWIKARQSPFLMGMDEEKRILIGFNMDVTKQLSTA